MEYLLAPASKTSDTPISESTKQEPFLVGHRKMKQGLLARAALYANNASKGTPAISQFNGILRVNRDPIVWGDASNRYNYKRTEINNNNSAKECLQQHGLQLTQKQLSREELRGADSYERPEHDVLTLTSSTPCIPRISSDGPRQAACHEDEPNSQAFESVIDENFETSRHQDEKAERVLSFDSTQQLRSGFFRSIKRQYSPLLPEKSTTKESPSNGYASDFHPVASQDENTDDSADQELTENFNSMSQMARQKLQQLRKRGPQNVDVPTGLQWIRLELHEMREQDKTLFLQLIKLHSTIKDLRSDFSCPEEFDSYDDLHSAASLWWPRRGCNIDVLPDFSSSDGAHLIRGGKSKSLLRRGFSLNYPSGAGRRYSPVYNGSFSPPDGSRNLIDSDSATATT